MQSLSKNILCEIFSFLSLKELCIISSTCSFLSKVSESDILWSQSTDSGSGATKKRIFCMRGLRTMRIFSNVYQIYQLSGHKASIRSIKTSQNKILTASEDGSVRLFNTRKSRGKVIVEHLNSVTSALFWERGVVSASADRMLKVWQKDKEVVSVSAHKSGITKLRLLNETTAVTGGYDGAVKLWSLLDPKPSPLLSFQDFTGDISVLEVSDNYISCASSNDDFIILHDLQSPSSQRTIDSSNAGRPLRLMPTTRTIRSLLLNAPLLYSGETDFIKVWDLRVPGPVLRLPNSSFSFDYPNRSGVFKMMLTDPFKLLAASNGLKGLVEYDLRTLAGNYFPVHDYQIMTACQGKGVLSNLVITSGSTKTFKYEISVYKTGSLNEFKKLVPGHKGVINCVDIGEDSIVSGAKDGSVRVLNFSKSKERLRKESKTISIFTG